MTCGCGIRPPQFSSANMPSMPGSCCNARRLAPTVSGVPIAQQIAVAETAVPIFRESRMVRHRAVEPEPAEPAVGEVQVDLLAQPPVRADAEAVADDQHPDQQLRIDRRPTHLAVERRPFAPHPVEFDKPVDRAQQMLRRHMPFERKLVEQRVLADLPLPHHPTAPSRRDGRLYRLRHAAFQRNPPSAAIR